MSVNVKYYLGSPGANGFNDPELAHVDILTVTRSGLTHTVITGGEAANLEALYISSIGGIYFDPNNVFTTPDGYGTRPVPASAYEKISVKYKI